MLMPCMRARTSPLVLAVPRRWSQEAGSDDGGQGCEREGPGASQGSMAAGAMTCGFGAWLLAAWRGSEGDDDTPGHSGRHVGFFTPLQASRRGITDRRQKDWCCEFYDEAGGRIGRRITDR
jgi:hypothetical protein